MRVQASPTIAGESEFPGGRRLGAAFGIANGCVLGLGCWAGLFWLVFG